MGPPLISGGNHTDVGMSRDSALLASMGPPLISSGNEQGEENTVRPVGLQWGRR